MSGTTRAQATNYAKSSVDQGPSRSGFEPRPFVASPKQAGWSSEVTAGSDLHASHLRQQQLAFSFGRLASPGDSSIVSIPVQPKLMLAATADHYEQEAALVVGQPARTETPATESAAALRNLPIGNEQTPIQRLITITKDQSAFDSSSETVEQLAVKYTKGPYDVDKNVFPFIIQHMDFQDAKFHDQKNFVAELTGRGVFFEALCGEFSNLLEELGLGSNTPTRHMLYVVAASGPYWDLNAGKLLLRQRLTKMQHSGAVLAQTEQMLEGMEGVGEETKEMTAEKVEKAKHTARLFTWLYNNSERFAFGLKQRITKQVAEVKRAFLAGELAYQTLDQAYDGLLLTERIDREFMRCIEQDIPEASDWNIKWPIIEYSSNVFVVLEGSEAEALNGLEAAFITFVESAFVDMEKGSVLGPGAIKLAFANAMSEEACYPGRVANVREALSPPPAPTLKQKCLASKKGRTAEEDEQGVLYVMAAHFQELPPEHDTLVAFKAWARGQLAGELSELGIDADRVDNTNAMKLAAWCW